MAKLRVFLHKMIGQLWCTQMHCTEIVALPALDVEQRQVANGITRA